MSIHRRLQHISDRWYGLKNTTERIGDERREQVAQKLNRAFSLGFLDREELEKRTDIVLRAKFEHELYWALEELPERIPEPAQTQTVAIENSSYEASPATVTAVVIATVVVPWVFLVLALSGVF